MGSLRARITRNHIWITLLALVVLLGGCASGGGSDAIAWQPVVTAPDPAGSPVAPLDLTPPAGDPAGVAATPAAEQLLMPLSPEELKSARPNELGLIPILEYHVITTDPGQEEQFVRLKTDFEQDLQWLYDNDFHVVPLREVIENRISAPAGKRPVVLTFDDATTSQFDATLGANGELVINPDSAVGVLESFFARHPDFGHTAHFAVVPNNCFAYPDESQHDLCPAKLDWLAARGYEIGNHTWNHTSLHDVDDETFVAEIGKTKQFIDEHVSGDANMGTALTLPFGDYPDKDLHPGQRRMMREGFWYNGERIQLTTALMVGANPTESPNSTEFDPLYLARVQMFDASVDQWFGWIADGTIDVYVSDGSPQIVTIPDILPESLDYQCDPDVVADWDRVLVRYDNDTGEVTESTLESVQGPGHHGDDGKRHSRKKRHRRA